MANDKTDKAADELSDYSARHPRRMWSGMFLVGTALGASLMAAKKNRDRSAVQKFLDQIGK
jgi:hypothetical protein